MDAIKILFSEKACGFDCDEISIGRFAAPCVSQNHDRHHTIIIISNLTESFILPGTEYSILWIYAFVKIHQWLPTGGDKNRHGGDIGRGR